MVSVYHSNLFYNNIFMLASCKAAHAPNSSIPPDIEIVHPMGAMIYYCYLQEVEERSDLIVRTLVKETFGYTKREIEITQVYKGSRLREDINI
jgi:hypothetical protein